MIRIGVDLGGTKTEAIAMDSEGRIVDRQRRPTIKDYAGTLELIHELVSALALTHETEIRVGIGHPGSTNPHTGLIRNANSTWLNGRSFAADLNARLPFPVRTANDANCFTLSEARDGAGRDAETVFGVILGTGVGGGLVIHGEALSGSQGNVGEWGHNPLPGADANESPGPKCWCGRHGCIETWLAGPGLSRDYLELGGAPLDAAEIFARAGSGDGAAKRSVDHYIDRLARGLASVINILDPDVIVLGGGVSNAPNLASQVQAKLADHVFSDTVTTRIIKNQHGDSSGVRGAAWLWPSVSP
jgi:fructokinase